MTFAVGLLVLDIAQLRQFLDQQIPVLVGDTDQGHLEAGTAVRRAFAGGRRRLGGRRVGGRLGAGRRGRLGAGRRGRRGARHLGAGVFAQLFQSETAQGLADTFQGFRVRFTTLTIRVQLIV